MGAQTILNTRAEAARATSAQPGALDTVVEKTAKPSLLVLAAARVRGQATPRAEGPPPAECTCGGLLARVASLLAGREPRSCERCSFFGHYSQ